MRYSKPFLSLAAGLFTPLPLLVVLNAIHGGWPIALTAACLAALGVALWPPISPACYGSALIVGAPVWFAVLAGSGRSSSLFGPALTRIAVAGVIVGLTAGLCATFIRYWPVPSWTPLAPIAAAAILIAFAGL